MDPVTMYRMGQLRQQEFLEWAAKRQRGSSARWDLSQLGTLLQRVGQKLEAAAGSAYKAQTIAPHTSVENC